MKEAINQFFKHYKNSSFLDLQKAKALFYIGSISSILIFLVTIFSFLNHRDNVGFWQHSTIPFTMILLTISSLTLLYKGKLAIAGNFLITGVLLLQTYSLFDRLYTNPVYENFIGGTYYYLLLLMVLGLLFSTRLNLILNFVIILISTIFILSTKKLSGDESIQNLLLLSQIDYTLALIILTITIWYSKLISSRSEALIKAEISAKEKQNQLLNELLTEVKKSSSKLYESSNQMTRISQIISQNSTEQSATTEEIAASMEQMLNSIIATTENAGYTEKISSDTAKETAQNKEIFEQTIQTINEINKKVHIISDISGKTDILSINAAIEAARSSEHGLGFAVVAQEIRKLADKTKDAAELIINLTEKGVGISKNAGDRLSKMLPEIQKSADLVKHIKLMSREQQSGVESITQAIQQLSTVTVKNAYESEKMAVSASVLFAEAEKLNKLTAKINQA